MKTIGFAVIAALAALVLGFGARLSAPTAHADTTGVAVVGCELIASAVDGATTDVTSALDFAAACGLAPLPQQVAAGPDVQSVELLADAIGDKDGVLEKSDFADIEGLDGENQVRAACTAAAVFCTLDAFVFVDDEKPVTLDLPSGLASVQNGTLDFECNTDASLLPLPGATLTTDNDCSDVVSPTSGPNNGDGVVLFHILNGNATAGNVKAVRVVQEIVDQTFDVTIVGAAHDVSLALVETVIQSNESSSAAAACQDTNDVADASSISQATTTVGAATVTDSDDTKLTRVPVTLASDDTDVAIIGINDPANGIVANTGETVDAGTSGVAQFFVICGGKTTGTATITATINPTLANEDSDSQDITVVGAPASIALTAAPAQIACDGSATSSVTAKVTDSAGDNVADGVTVNFSVVALGTANPINVKTSAGSASSTVTPLSGATAGVTVIVTSGDAQASIRVDCSLPIPTPTSAGPAPTPTRAGVITVSDTGNGGYLGQDSSAGFPMWTLVALALGSVALVAGGLVTRRAGK